MCESNFRSRKFAYSFEHPDGLPTEVLNPDEVFVLIDTFHSKGGPFQRLLDCGGIRYALLLEFKEVTDCLENALLQKMYQAFHDEDFDRSRNSLGLVSAECMKTFWPYLNYDFKMRRMNGTLMDPVCPLQCDAKDCHRLQLKTIEGSVCAIEHDTLFDHEWETFENPYPDLLCFSRSEVEVLETIGSTVFKVQIQGEEYCLKTDHLYLMRAIEKLRAAPCHPNIVSLGGAVVNPDGRILGLLTPFICGVLLSDISSATATQKAKWKAKISEAIRLLHHENIVWGDAKPQNIIIRSTSDEPVLIDFDGGATEGWIDDDLCNTMEGDLQALPRILKFVDDIPGSTA